MVASAAGVLFKIEGGMTTDEAIGPTRSPEVNSFVTSGTALEVGNPFFVTSGAGMARNRPPGGSLLGGGGGGI